MRLRAVALAVLCFLLTPALANADTFTLAGTLVDGGSFNGTLAVNAGGSAFVQGTFTNGAYSFTLPSNYLGEQLGEGNFSTLDAFPVRAPLFDLFLVFPQSTLASYTGGTLCAIDSPCLNAPYSLYSDPNTPQSDFLTLTATPTAPPPAIPEPGSLALFGTGLFTLAAAARKRQRP